MKFESKKVISNRKLVCAHVLVKNEARFIWYSIMSVLPHVDRMRIWDMGSTDGTRKIINNILKLPISKGKVFYNDRVISDFNEARERQEMLDNDSGIFGWSRKSMLDGTKADWIIVLDGDEIWWDSSIKKVIDTIQKKGDNLESIVVPFLVPVGDIFHFQENEAGRYKFGDIFGHYALRAINRKIEGLSSIRPHGQWGWSDIDGKMIQDRDSKKILFLNTPYLHTTHLQRAGTIKKDGEVVKRKKKLKHEIGISISKDFFFPEVFFRRKPSFVKSPWGTMKFWFRVRSLIETPFRKINRRIFFNKVGY